MSLFWRAVGVVLATAVGLAAQEHGGDFFEEQVRPVLSACSQCHNEKLATSGLALHSRERLLQGGNRGAAVELGNPEQSLLLRAVRQNEELKMPPGGKLSPGQIDVLARWIEAGAPWGETAEASSNAGRRGTDHWAFQPPKRHPSPEVRDASWVRNPIDSFVLATLDSKGLEPSPEASRETLLRRVGLDLTGLPPSPKEIAAFVADDSPDAYEKAVDRLLASPHYGERWGRHWLDLARYADSDGYSIDAPRPMWKYRDWVIEAINRDQPFDQFVIEQIAGDLLPYPTTEQLIATGFHRNTPSNFEGGIDFEQYRVEAVADRVATTGAVFLGLTVGCARCHDHKYDPLSQREFYELFAYFNSTDEITKESERHDFYRPVLFLPTPEEEAAADAYWAQVHALSRELMEHVDKLRSLPREEEEEAPAIEEDPGLLARVETLRTFMKRGGLPGSPEYHWRQPEASLTRTLITRDLPEPRESYVHLGGDFLKRGVAVEPTVPKWLSDGTVTGNRLDLAKWLVSTKNPLTARVTMNRMWQALFGLGIVETENDFGLMGSPPSHPELLDWLAIEFMEQGWSRKAMLKRIVTSATYRQESRHRPELEEIDPYNRLLARQSRVRLDAEIIRDSALAASSLLTPTRGGPGVHPPIPKGAMAVTQVERPWPTEVGANRYRRGVYTFFFRMSPPPSLVLFDAPTGAETCTRRVRSTSPLQALTLLNDQAFLEFAVALGKRILAEAPADDRSRLEYAALLTLGRKPMPNEMDRLATLLEQQKKEYAERPSAALDLTAALEAGTGRATDAVTLRDAPELAAWASVGRVLMNVDDFLTRE